MPGNQVIKGGRLAGRHLAVGPFVRRPQSAVRSSSKTSRFCMYRQTDVQYPGHEVLSFCKRRQLEKTNKNWAKRRGEKREATDDDAVTIGRSPPISQASALGPNPLCSLGGVQLTSNFLGSRFRPIQRAQRPKKMGRSFVAGIALRRAAQGFLIQLPCSLVATLLVLLWPVGGIRGRYRRAFLAVNLG